MSDPGTQSRNTSCTHSVVMVTRCPLCREEHLRAALAEAVEWIEKLTWDSTYLTCQECGGYQKHIDPCDLDSFLKKHAPKEGA